MVDYEAFETMQDLVEEVGDSIGITREEYHDQAIEMYEYLGVHGGHIDLIGPATPGIYTETAEELAEWDDDNLPCSYGIDASRTQERSFSNGIRVTFANAKAGVIGEGSHRLGDKNHIVAAIYDKHRDTELETRRYHESQSVTADIEVIDDSDPQEARRMVADIARTLSEGRHLNTVYDTMLEDEKPGVVFVDGPIYPPLILNEVMGQHYIGSTDAWTGILGQLIGNYVDAAEKSITSGWPVVGIVKTMDTTSLITDLKSKVEEYGPKNAELHWTKDDQFLTDLLQTDGPGTYVYTDWFEESARYCRTNDEDGNEYVEPFNGCPHGNPNRDRVDYHRAFFYVHNPKTNTIMRVETPKVLIQDATSRELIQMRSLSEIAKMGNSAEAILRADAEARISRKNQQDLFAKLYGKMSSVTDYNEDYRGPEYTNDQST